MTRRGSRLCPKEVEELVKKDYTLKCLLCVCDRVAQTAGRGPSTTSEAVFRERFDGRPLMYVSKVRAVVKSRDRLRDALAYRRLYFVLR